MAFAATEEDALAEGRAKAIAGELVAAFNLGDAGERQGGAIHRWLVADVGVPPTLAGKLVAGIGSEIRRAVREGRIE